MAGLLNGQLFAIGVGSKVLAGGLISLSLRTRRQIRS
jgi:hypothetical protein